MNGFSSLISEIRAVSQPRSRLLHLLPHDSGTQLFLVDGSQLYDLPSAIAQRLEEVLASEDEETVLKFLSSLGADLPVTKPDSPDPAEVHAISLAIAQKCNMACGYCYAQQGSFGANAKAMSEEVALRSIDLLLEDKPAGSRVHLAFLGGEPLQNRAVLRDATEYAAQRAAERGIHVGYAITTNGTLLKPSDAEFFERHAFAVTVSLDGAAREHDRLRPLKNGRGSFGLIMRNIAPLLARQQRMQVSARVTVTPSNLDLPGTLDFLIGHGFHSVGFSPLLHSPTGKEEMSEGDLAAMLEAMVGCGLAFERQVLLGTRYPFLNMVNALRELHRGSHRSYPCGAGVSYLGVSADGDLAACHRFVGDDQGRLGSLFAGVDGAAQSKWLQQRRVEAQAPCRECWARHLCGGGCHHEVLARGRPACDYIRGWLHYTIQAYGRLSRLAPHWFTGAPQMPT